MSKNLNFGNSMPSVTYTKKNGYSIYVPNFTCLFTSDVSEKFETITLKQTQVKLNNCKSTNLKKYYRTIPFTYNYSYWSLFRNKDPAIKQQTFIQKTRGLYVRMQRNWL